MDIEEIRSRHWALPSRGGSEDIEALLGEVDRLRQLACWYAREACEAIDPGEGVSCAEIRSLMPEERCGPCQARLALGLVPEPA